MIETTIYAILKDNSEIEIVMIDTIKGVLVTIHFDELKFDDIKDLQFRKLTYHPLLSG